jgi:DNA-binding Xre family transcriptional regulator
VNIVVACDWIEQKEELRMLSAGNGPIGQQQAPGRARFALAKKVRLLRVTRGWSQEVLAEVSGLHRTYISMIERQDKNVGLDNLERLAEAFGVSIGELVGS